MIVLKKLISLFSIIFLFVSMATMLIVAMASESAKVLFEMVKNYELPKQRFGELLRDFRSHSKPAYY